VEPTRRILCYSRNPMNSVMLRPLVRPLQGDERLGLWFAGKPTQPGETLRQALAPLDAPRRPAPRRALVPHALVRWRRFDLFITPVINMPARRARHRVQVFHGVSFKGRPYSEKIHAFNHVFLVGEYMRRRFVEKGIFEPDDPRLHRIGMPKTDPLVDASVSRAATLETMRLDPARPTVLYAPTWRKESSLNREGEAIVDALDRMGLNVLVKIHDHSRDPAENRRDWVAWLHARENERVRRVRDPDIVPYLAAADALVTDASSVANEFTLVDRPILFMDVPELLEVYSGTADTETWCREETGVVVRGADGVRGAVEAALSDPTAQSASRRAAAADIFYNPGRATRTALDAIYGILELPAPGSPTA
jgi:hypothetical protein